MVKNLLHCSLYYSYPFSYRKGHKGNARFAKNKRLYLRPLRNSLRSLRLIHFSISMNNAG